MSELYDCDMSKNQNTELLSDIKALKHPNFHKLNEHAGRNDRLLHAVLCAYVKHHMGSDEFGWQELSGILHDAICNEIGDVEYLAWGSRLNAD